MTARSLSQAAGRTLVPLGLTTLLIASAPTVLAGAYSNGVYEQQYFGGQVTVRLEFQPDEAIAFDFREVVESHGGYQYPYTYFLIPQGYRSSILSYSVAGGARVTLTRSNDQFDWSSRRLITGNPFRMETNRYYRFQIGIQGQTDVYAYFALETADPPVSNVEMEVSGAPWLDVNAGNRALIPADERFPAVFKLRLLDADKFPKEPVSDPQSVIVTVADREQGTLDSSAGSGSQITLTTDSNGEAEFRYHYTGLVPTSEPIEETISIQCPAFGLAQTVHVGVGLKPKLVGVVDRWDSRSDLPRTMGLRIQIEDEFWPQLDYLEYNRVLASHQPEGRYLAMYLSTEWLNPPKPGHWESFLNGLGVASLLRPGEDQFFDGRGYVWKFEDALFESGGRQLMTAIDSPAIELELRFPAHVFNRVGTRWFTAQVGLILYPENVEDPVERIIGAESNTLIYAVDVMAGGESVLQSVACAFKPTSAVQYWVKYTINHDYFKQALVTAGGVPVILAFQTVKLFDLACDFMKGNYFGIMQGALKDYVKNLNALREAGKIDLTPAEVRLLAAGIAANQAKQYSDHYHNTVRADSEPRNRVLGKTGGSGRAVLELPEVPDDVDPADLRPIFDASVAGLMAGLGEPQAELVIVSDGSVRLENSAGAPYPVESILHAAEGEGSNVYIVPANSVVFVMEHSGPVEITRFLPSGPDAIDMAFYSVADPGAASTTALDCSGGWGVSAQVDVGSDGSVDWSVAPASASYAALVDDGDGVPTAVEDQGPNAGDANRDGVPDSMQPHVASLPNAIDSRYVTLVAPEGVNLSGVQALAEIAADPAPLGVAFPLGVFQFHVDGVGEGEAVTVAMMLPEGVSANSFYTYGSTPRDSIDRWQVFPWDGQTGAEMEPGLVRLHFRDALPGDDYPLTDGLVVTVGAPAQVSRGYQLNFAQFATGGGLFSEITLLNRSVTEPADAEVDFWADQGEALTFQLEERMVRGQLQLSIPPLGLRMLQTEGSGSLLAGSAGVRSNRPLAGVVVFGGAFGLAGVGSSEGLTAFVAPMERISSRNINTGIAVMNLEDAPVTLTLQLHDREGETLATASETLPGRGHKAVFVNQFDWSPAVGLSDFLGTLRCTSSGPIAVTVLQTRPGQFATMPVAAGTGDADSGLNIAHFATGGGLFSELILLNLDPQEEAAVEVTFRDDGGNPLVFQLGGESVNGTRQLSIPASGIRVLETDGSGPLVAGSAEVSSNRSLAGVLVFGGDFGLAGVGSSEETGSFLAPMQRMTARGINTGIAVMSLDDSPQTLQLRLRDRDGQQLATATETLAARGHKAVFVNQFRWLPSVDLSAFQGVLEVTTDGRIAVTVLQTRPGQFATMPVVGR